MLGFIKRLFNKESAPVGAMPRSSKWPTVRKRYLEKFPNCAACGESKELEVHHCEPYHLKPELELDENNLITLCRTGKSGMPCHLLIGHCGDWSAFNKNVRDDAKRFCNMIQSKSHRLL